MHWIDWLIVCIPLLIVGFIGFRTQRYVKGVSDFLTAGRVAGRYVVAVANGEAAMGLISLVAMFEMYYKSGFALSFWSAVAMPMSVLMALTGFCIYRFRETRAMTMGQFFGMRYSKSFRIFAAVLQSISGIINYAIFPAVGARFLIYFCGLPLKVYIFGYAFPTFALVMAGFLSIAVLIVMLGGQITIMVTDCVQGILSYPMYVIVVVYILVHFSWFDQMAPTLLNREPGKSMLNPYDISKLRDFNVFYVLVGIFGGILNRMSWSGNQGYNAAAATPHEQKMGNILGSWRSGFSVMMYILLAIAAYTFLNNSDFSKPANNVRNELSRKVMNDVADKAEFAEVRSQAEQYLQTGEISPAMQIRLDQVAAEDNLQNGNNKNSDKTPAPKIDHADPLAVVQTALKSENRGEAKSFGTIFNQMRVPMALKEMLPIGITGVFCAIMIFLLISTDTTYMHSWGSIIVQDVILPFRSEPFTPKQQLLLLRCVIAGVAIFAFLFSFLFGQIDYILMFFAITGAIYCGGAGPAIVFGLYWKRGTTAGAFGALIGGGAVAVGGIFAQKYWMDHIYPFLVNHGMINAVRWFLETVSKPFHPYIVWTVTPDKFPINSMEFYLLSMLVALGLYFGLSFLTCRKPFNMDRMLHRGKYRREGTELQKEKLTVRNALKTLLGIDSQYTRGDKALTWSVFIYTFVWQFGSFVVLVIWNAFSPWPNSWWANWFLFYNIILAGAIGIVTTVWFTIGGTIDLSRMFKRLKEKEVNVLDDGRVVGHVSAEDIELVEKVDHVVIEDAHLPPETEKTK